ncbi:hypothetical protein D3C87_1710130 [compost metagenome]
MAVRGVGAVVDPLALDLAAHGDGVARGVERLHAKAADGMQHAGRADVLANGTLPHALQQHDVGVHLWRAGRLGVLGVVVDGVEVAVGAGGHHEAVDGEGEGHGVQGVALVDFVPVALFLPVHLVAFLVQGACTGHRVLPSANVPRGFAPPP